MVKQNHKFQNRNISIRLLNNNEVNIKRRKCQNYMLERFDGNRNVSLEMKTLRASNKSQVFLADIDGSRSVVKVHEESSTFNSELFALVLFNESNLTPKLLSYNERRRILELEYFEKPQDSLSEDRLTGFAKYLAEFHGNLAVRAVLSSSDYADLRCGKIADAQRNSSARSREYHAYLESLVLLAEVFGDDYVPFAAGDIKQEHLFLKDEKIVMLDFDSFRLGVLEQIDLLSVLNLTETIDFSSGELRDFIECYLNFRRSAGRLSIDVGLYLRSVGLAAESVGRNDIAKTFL
jgi:hypothetical protein